MRRAKLPAMIVIVALLASYLGVSTHHPAPAVGAAQAAATSFFAPEATATPTPTLEPTPTPPPNGIVTYKAAEGWSVQYDVNYWGQQPGHFDPSWNMILVGEPGAQFSVLPMDKTSVLLQHHQGRPFTFRDTRECLTLVTVDNQALDPVVARKSDGIVLSGESTKHSWGLYKLRNGSIQYVGCWILESGQRYLIMTAAAFSYDANAAAPQFLSVADSVRLPGQATSATASPRAS